MLSKNKEENGIYGGLTRMIKSCESGKMERPANVIDTIKKTMIKENNKKVSQKDIDLEKADSRLSMLKR